MNMYGGMVHNVWLLLTLFLRGILAGDWSVHLPSSPICAAIGSTVILPCSYDYPQGSNETREEGQLSTEVEEGGEGLQYKVLSEMWCLEDSRCVTPRYVFHSAGIFPDPSYQNRVEYLGQPGSQNCSLMISDLKQSDSGTYVFYLITSHPTEKMPAQSGVQLLVGDSSAVTVLASPSRDITEGVSLRLACCSPVLSPQAFYRWHKNTSTKDSDQVWSISEVTADDSGSYYCQIQNDDKVQNSTMLDIDVQYAPRNTSVTVSAVGALHEELPVILTCSSDANPPVHTYIWYQGEACLPTADKSFHQGRRTVAMATGRGLTLRSASISAAEYGQHCCVARNKHGSQIYTVTLRRTRAATPSLSTGRKVVLIGASIGILLAIIAVIVFLIRRGRKSSRYQSYVLTETTAPEL